MSTKKILFSLTVLSTLAFALSASALPLTYDLTGSDSPTGTPGNSFTVTSAGVDLTVSAYNTTNFSDYSTLLAAHVGRYDNGVGVSTGSDIEEPWIDNLGLNEFVLLEFSEEIEEVELQLTANTPFAGQSGLYVLGANRAPGFSLAGETLSSLQLSYGFTEIGTFSGTSPNNS